VKRSEQGTERKPLNRPEGSKWQVMSESKAFGIYNTSLYFLL